MDTPVKRYSSGMYVRLAFAVAAHLEPEILVVDEVLAVGDAEFQKKCLGKMKEVSGKGGRTVLFVSHNMNAISTLTSKCAFLEKGKIKSIGSSSLIVPLYLQKNETKNLNYVSKETSRAQTKICSITVETSYPNAIQESGEEIKFIFEIFCPTRKDGRTFSFQIVDIYEKPIVHIWRFDQEAPFLREKGIHKITCLIEKIKLNIGKYTIKTYLGGAPGSKTEEVIENVCPFEVVIYKRSTLFGWRPETCVYYEEAKWEEKKYAKKNS